MPTLKALMGKIVVCDGRKLGRMVQADLTEDLKRLRGVWVSSGWRGERYLSAECLETLGENVILADGAGRRSRVKASPILRRAIGTDGSRLGAVVGARIDPISFAVTDLEVSAGFWDDLVNRRRRILRYAVNRTTGDVVIDIDAPGKGGMEE